jgi:hypothetical protein
MESALPRIVSFIAGPPNGDHERSELIPIFAITFHSPSIFLYIETHLPIPSTIPCGEVNKFDFGSFLL